MQEIFGQNAIRFVDLSVMLSVHVLLIYTCILVQRGKEGNAVMLICGAMNTIWKEKQM